MRDEFDDYLDRTRGKDEFDDYLARQQSSTSLEPETSAGQSALEHYGNTMLAGYLPHVQALAGKLMPDPSGGVDAELEKQGFTVNNAPEPSYIESRDANLKRLELEAKEHPVGSGIGTGIGIVGSGLMLPAGALAKGASLGAKAAQGAKIGAAYGAIQNPGDKEGEVDPLQLGDRVKNAGIGAAVGGAVPVAIEGASSAAKKVSDYLRTKAAEKAFRSLGRGTPQSMQKMVKSGENVAIGRELLDEGAIPVLGTPRRIQDRVAKLKESAGEEVGNLVKGAGNAKVVDAEKLGIQILDSPELALMRKTPGMESAVASIEKQVETLAKNGTMSLEEAQALRQQIDKSINWNKASPDIGASKGLKMQRTGIRDAMNEGINTLSPGAPKDQLLAANRKYGNMATADDILDKELARNQSNRAISLTDTIAAASGPTLTAKAALGAANKIGRTFGNSAQARTYDAISKKLAAVPGLAAKAEANPAIVQMIAQRTGRATPEFRHQDNPVLKNQKLMEIFRQDPSLIESIQDEATKSLVRKEIQKGKRTPSGQER